MIQAQEQTAVTQARRTRRWALIACLLLLCSQAVYAETSLWQISRGDTSLYLGGTIHVLRQSDYPLPEAYQRAFDDSALIGFETDLSQINSALFQQTMLDKARYPAGEYLSDHLSVEALLALQEYCQGAGIPIDALMPFKPAVAMLTMLSMELARLDAVSSGVDNYFMQQALEAGKPMLGLETAEQQLDHLVTMGEGQESEFILHSLQDLGELESLLQQMIGDWRSGDTEGLYRLFVEPLAQEQPGIYDSLLVQRNQAWLPKIEHLLETEATELVLVGVAHLVGEDGLLDALQARGYKVEQIP